MGLTRDIIRRIHHRKFRKQNENVVDQEDGWMWNKKNWHQFCAYVITGVYLDMGKRGKKCYLANRPINILRSPRPIRIIILSLLIPILPALGAN
jgi:hypothetical protein